MRSKKKKKSSRIKTISILGAILCVIFSGCGKTEENLVGTCSLLIECSTIFDNMDKLDDSLKGYIPHDGIILSVDDAEVFEGDSVYDVLKRETQKEGILMEASFTANSAYVEGINNIYEFSCGELSGWEYCVNEEYPGIGCGGYAVSDKDVIEWHYTCNLGDDLK